MAQLPFRDPLTSRDDRWHVPPIDRRPDRLGVTARSDHVERFARGAGLIDWVPDELAACWLDEDVARLLAVAVLLEEDTAISAAQARALGLDRAPDMAVFLTAWEEEEAEHARALRCLTAGHVGGRPPSRPAGNSLKRHGQALVPARLLGRFGPVGVAFCTLGAAAEYVAIVIYTELAKATADPAAAALLRAIIRQEGRHLGFFLAAAQQRAAGMPLHEQRLARWLVARLWTPVGMATLGTDRWWDQIGPLLEQPEVRARVQRMDRVVDAVPHLVGLGLMGGLLAAHPRATTNPPRGVSP